MGAADRRKSYRCQTPSEREIAMLRFGKSEAVVKIVEESAVGMGILAPKSVVVAPGDQVAVISSAGICEAQIVRIMEQGSEHRIGLRRVRDLGKHPNRKRREGPTKWISMNSLSIAVAGLALAALGGVLLKDFLRVDPVMSPMVFESATSANHVDRTREVASGFQQLGGLTDKSISSYLLLTGQQQRQIESTVDELTRKLALLYAQRPETPDNAWADQGLFVLRDSWLQIESVLTDEQRARWQALVTKKEPAAKTEKKS